MPSKPRIQITADAKKETRVFATEFARQRVMINEGFATKAFQYELSDFPPAVFHNGQMRKASKHKFLNYLCCTCESLNPTPSTTVACFFRILLAFGNMEGY